VFTGVRHDKDSRETYDTNVGTRDAGLEIGAAAAALDADECYDGYAQDYDDDYAQDYDDGYAQDYDDGYAQDYDDGYAQNYDDAGYDYYVDT
jgi:hypothetical protein